MLSGQYAADRTTAEVMIAMLHLAKEWIEHRGERRPAGRATQSTTFTKISVIQPADRTGQARRNVYLGKRPCQLENCRVTRPALLGAAFTQVHLRNLTLDNLGQVDSGGGATNGARDGFAHQHGGKRGGGDWQGEAGHGV